MIYKLFWSLPTAIIFLLVYNCVVNLLLRMDRGSYIKQNIFVIYIAFVLTITLDLDRIWVSIWYRWPLPDVALFSGNINFSLFSNIGSLRGKVMLLENIVLFLPFGLLLHTLIKKEKCLETVLIALLVSGAIGCIQFTIGRAFDIDDLAMNTLGALIGWILWKQYQQIVNK